MVEKNLLTQWEKKAELLGRFYELTRAISALLYDKSTHENHREIENHLEERERIISEISSMPEFSNEPQSEDDIKSIKKYEWLCENLLKKTNELEQNNVSKIDSVLSEYKGKLTAKKQDRQTISAYSEHMSYAGDLKEGGIIDKYK